MVIRMVGAALTLLSGVLYAANITKEHRAKERDLEEFMLILEHFSWELQTNLSPLAVCCLAAARCGRGKIGALFADLAERLEYGAEASAAECMAQVRHNYNISFSIAARLDQLGDTLGRYDLSGQIAGIKAIGELCRRDLRALAAERTKTVKTCQTLGLCTGAAVAILLF